ncbi:hypothetical protein [Prosthecobacter sp.]|uniref:hypothetical protein n=1 Tax=Prosthecobacter sp. TaxID=1965333 RepID=UPI0037838DFC
MNVFLAVAERISSPELIIIYGGVSRKSEKWFKYLKASARIVPARLHNDERRHRRWRGAGLEQTSWNLNAEYNHVAAHTGIGSAHLRFDGPVRASAAVSSHFHPARNPHVLTPFVPARLHNVCRR